MPIAVLQARGSSGFRVRATTGLGVSGGRASSADSNPAHFDQTGIYAATGAAFALATQIEDGLDVYATEKVFFFLDASYVVPAAELRKYDCPSFGAGLGYRR
jgi:hypothetical protein